MILPSKIKRPFVHRPYAHQLREWFEHRDTPARAQFWEMRSGKSKSAIDLACELYPSEIQAVVILAPNKVHTNWILKEFPEHAWMPWVGHAWSSKFRTRPWHRKALKDVLQTKDLAVLAMNNEAILTDDGRKAVQYLVNNKATMLIVDEAHHYRAAGSRRSKRVRPLARLCPWRRILTGTPTADSPLGLWAMMELVEPGALGFTRFEDYRNFFFIEEPMKASNGRWFSTWRINPNRQAELQSRLAQWASVVLREDCADLPAVTFTRRYFELSTNLQRVYDCIKDETEMELETKFGIDMELTSAMKRLAKLQQVTSGFVYEDDGTVRHFDENPRMDTLLETIREVPAIEKHVIWCQFKEDCRRVRRRLDEEQIPAVEFHGDIGSLERDAAYSLFQNDPCMKAIVAQPAACGEGLDFSSARRMIWYSHTWRLTHRDQASARCTAVGGRDVEVIDLVAQRTVDDRILDLLVSKQDVANYMTGAGLQDLLRFLGDSTRDGAKTTDNHFGGA